MFHTIIWKCISLFNFKSFKNKSAQRTKQKCCVWYILLEWLECSFVSVCDDIRLNFSFYYLLVYSIVNLITSIKLDRPIILIWTTWKLRVVKTVKTYFAQFGQFQSFFLWYFLSLSVCVLWPIESNFRVFSFWNNLALHQMCCHSKRT